MKDSVSNKLYGFYSQQAAELYGHSIWRKPDGKNVAATVAFPAPDYPEYDWVDKICVGEIETRLRDFTK